MKTTIKFVLFFQIFFATAVLAIVNCEHMNGVALRSIADVMAIEATIVIYAVTYGVRCLAIKAVPSFLKKFFCYRVLRLCEEIV